MIIGVLYLELYMPYCHSLKEKRKIVNGLKNKLHARYNVAVSEVKYQDLWQRAGLGVVSVGVERAQLEGIFSRILKELEFYPEAQVINNHLEFL